MLIFEVIVGIMHVATGAWEGKHVLEEVKADAERGDYMAAYAKWAEYAVHETGGSDPNVALTELVQKLLVLLKEEADKQQHQQQNTSADITNSFADGALSEDGQWRFDATSQEWIAANTGATTEQQYATTPSDGALSDDGQWRWNASTQEWAAANAGSAPEQQYADTAVATDQYSGVTDGTLSDDGQWRWDASTQQWAANA
jgi:hypothetical protein